MKYEALLREKTNASKINSKFCQKKKKGRNHVNIINKYFLPCFHFLIRESCPFFFSFVFFLLLFFVCLFLSFFILFNFYKLSFFFICKKKICTYRSKLSLDWEKHYLCLHSWCIIVYLYMVFLFLVCVHFRPRRWRQTDIFLQQT